MDKRPMRRVHQPGDGVVDRRGEADALDQARGRTLETVNDRDFRRRDGVVTEIDPDIALDLARRIGANMHAAGPKGLARHQCRDRGPLPCRVEPPAMIAALDLTPVKAAGCEPYAAMRAQIAQRER